MTPDDVIAAVTEDGDWLFQFVQNLLCLRCGDALAKGDPPEAELCRDCEAEVQDQIPF